MGQENDLALSSFSVTATCAAGYSGHAVVTPCPAADEEYGVSGCVQACTAPPEAHGGNYAVTESSLEWGSNFDVTATCCSGSGTVSVRMCPIPDTPYGLSGCSGSYHGCDGASTTPAPTPTPSSRTVTLYVINPTTGQCGESAIPQEWLTPALHWATGAGYSIAAGNCASAGYTVPAGQTTVPRTSAPGGSDPVVMLYTQATSCVDDQGGQLSAFGYTCAQAVTVAGAASCSFDLSTAGFSSTPQALSDACPATCHSCAGTGPGGH